MFLKTRRALGLGQHERKGVEFKSQATTKYTSGQGDKTMAYSGCCISVKVRMEVTKAQHSQHGPQGEYAMSLSTRP